MRVINVKNFIRTEANELQNILLENIDGRSIAQRIIEVIPFSYSCWEKEFSKNLCFGFIIGISLTFCDEQLCHFFFQELSHKDTMEIGHYRFFKRNLSQLTSVLQGF